MNKPLTKKQVAAFMAAHHPDMKFSRAADSWIGGGYGIYASDASREAQAEKELFEEGIIVKPRWLDA